MGLIAGQIYREMYQALRGAGSDSLNMQDIANDMGEYLCGLRSWKWKEPRPRYFDLRGTLSLTDGDFTVSTLTLTPAALDPFADYTWVRGDRIRITGGTSIIDEERILVTGTSGSSPVSLVLEKDITTDAIDTIEGDVTGELRLETFEVDEDVKEIIDIEVTDGLFNGITLTTKRDMLRKRTSQLETTSPWEYFVTFGWEPDSNGIMYPLGEVWPAPQSDSTQAFMGMVKTGWAYLSADTSVVRIPTWLYRLYKELCRQAWMGMHEHEGIGFEQRMAMVIQGPTYNAARIRDASFQPDQGPIQNGHASRAGANHSLFNNDSLMGGPV